MFGEGEREGERKGKGRKRKETKRKERGKLEPEWQNVTELQKCTFSIDWSAMILNCALVQTESRKSVDLGGREAIIKIPNNKTNNNNS